MCTMEKREEREGRDKNTFHRTAPCPLQRETQRDSSKGRTTAL